MRFKRWPRVAAYQETGRKRAAFRRRQQAQQDKLPLFAGMIAETQPTVDEEMARCAAHWPRAQQRRRDERGSCPSSWCNFGWRLRWPSLRRPWVELR